MDDTPKPGDDRSDLVRRLWEANTRILGKRGYDLNQIVGDWAQRQEAQLLTPGAGDDFRELAAKGCVRQILAALLALLKWSPRVEVFWKQLYGNLEQRRRTRRSLEKASSMLADLFRFTIPLEDDEFAEGLAETGHLSPSRLVTELKLYSSTLDFLDRFPRETHTRSFEDFLRFVLIDYVKETTGRFRDRNVSALLGEVVGPSDYNEVAQRMWRNRNYRRMKKHYPLLSELLVTLGQVLTNRA